jgi:hypothetical protein
MLKLEQDYELWTKQKICHKNCFRGAAPWFYKLEGDEVFWTRQGAKISDSALMTVYNKSRRIWMKIVIS